jgi:hypothetical protein
LQVMQPRLYQSHCYSIDLQGLPFRLLLCFGLKTPPWATFPPFAIGESATLCLFFAGSTFSALEELDEPRGTVEDAGWMSILASTFSPYPPYTVL